MTPDDRIAQWKLHNSQRGWFGRALYIAMAQDERIVLLTGDLGYGIFDAHKEDFPDRYYNVGAAEQVLLGAACGMAIDHKLIPFCYSITPFLVYRPMEWLRNYLHHENIPVTLVGAGMNDDYKHDGFTHHAFEAKKVMRCLPNIVPFYPHDMAIIPSMVRTMCSNNRPCFMGLRR